MSYLRPTQSENMHKNSLKTVRWWVYPESMAIGLTHVRQDQHHPKEGTRHQIKKAFAKTLAEAYLSKIWDVSRIRPQFHFVGAKLSLWKILVVWWLARVYKRWTLFQFQMFLEWILIDKMNSMRLSGRNWAMSGKTSTDLYFRVMFFRKEASQSKSSIKFASIMEWYSARKKSEG